MKLSRALRLPKTPIVALVGAGGKTTALFMLAKELQPSFVTTTTHLGEWQANQCNVHIVVKTGAKLPNIPVDGVILVTGKKENNRFLGVDIGLLGELKNLAGDRGVSLLIEADGARQRPLKAPAPHEPAIPDFSNTVIVTAGLKGLNNPLGDEYVHRPEQFSQISTLEIGKPVTVEALRRVLTHPSGGIKNIPVNARKIALLNQAVTPELQSLGKLLAEKILPTYDAVVITSLQANNEHIPDERIIHAVHEQTAGIILAAGGSTRFGQPKQLLDFHGKPFVRVIAEKAVSAGLDPVILVTGSSVDEVKHAVDGLQLQVVHNPFWQSGQSASIRAGVSSLPAKCGGAIFLLSDQPQVSIEVIRTLVDFHSRDLPAVLAPYVNDKRANPVLFDRETFNDLLKLEGDQGGRAIFSKFNPAYLDWTDDHLLMDVDTPEDYQRLLENENGS
jgi:molybdenum cofactor cytidylyltransferase